MAAALLYPCSIPTFRRTRNGISEPYFLGSRHAGGFHAAGGKLYVPGAEHLLPNIRKLTDAARHGRVFLVDTFHGNVRVAGSLNRLLVTGFCLIAIGYVVVFAPRGTPMDATRLAIDLTLNKAGSFLIVLGLVHLLGLFILSRIRSTRAGHHASGWAEGSPLGKVLD